MPNNWVSDQYKAWSDKKAEIQGRRQLDERAATLSDSYFESLKQQVKQDISTCNALFGEPRCQCDDYPLGFVAYRHNRALQDGFESHIEVTKKPHDTVVSCKLSLHVSGQRDRDVQPFHLELRPDYQTAQFYFYRDGNRLDTVEAASQALLNRIIPGPDDLQSR